MISSERDMDLYILGQRNFDLHGDILLDQNDSRIISCQLLTNPENCPAIEFGQEMKLFSDHVESQSGYPFDFVNPDSILEIFNRTIKPDFYKKMSLPFPLKVTMSIYKDDILGTFSPNTIEIYNSRKLFLLSASIDVCRNIIIPQEDYDYEDFSKYFVLGKYPPELWHQVIFYHEWGHLMSKLLPKNREFDERECNDFAHKQMRLLIQGSISPVFQFNNSK